MNLLNKIFPKVFNRKPRIRNMAKAPKIGSRLKVAKFAHEKALKGDKQYKVIQPQILSYHDETYFWSCKVISVGETSSVGIARKSEEGFIIIIEKGKKMKVLMKVVKDKVTMLPLPVEGDPTLAVKEIKKLTVKKFKEVVKK